MIIWQPDCHGTAGCCRAKVALSAVIFTCSADAVDVREQLSNKLHVNSLAGNASDGVDIKDQQHPSVM